MRDVHDHAQIVHSSYDASSEIGETVVTRRFRRRVGPVVVERPRQRHISHAEIVERRQHAEIVFDGVTSFDRHERGDPAFLVQAANIGGGSRERDFLGMRGDRGVQRVGQRECARQIVSLEFRLNPKREKLGGQSAGLHARNVEVTVGKARAPIDVFVEEALRRVGVEVHDDSASMNFTSDLQLIHSWLFITGSFNTETTEHTENTEKPNSLSLIFSVLSVFSVFSVLGFSSSVVTPPPEAATSSKTRAPLESRA